MKVALPPFKRFMLLLNAFVLPADGVQLEPPDVEHVQETVVKVAGRVSVNTAPVTACGPPFETTTV